MSWKPWEREVLGKEDASAMSQKELLSTPVSCRLTNDSWVSNTAVFVTSSRAAVERWWGERTLGESSRHNEVSVQMRRKGLGKRSHNDMNFSCWNCMYKMCTRSSQSEFQHGLDRGFGSRTLAEELLAVDICWGKKSQFSSWMGQLRSYPFSSKWAHTCTHIGNTKWSQCFFFKHL